MEEEDQKQRKSIFYEIIGVVVLLIILVLAASGLSSCTTGILSEDIEAPLKKVRLRHDKYIEADTALSSLQKRTYLRTTELLENLVEEAKK